LLSSNGQSVAVRRSSAEVGRRLSLRFEAISEAEFLQILLHYHGQRSGFDAFTFPIATLPSSYTPAGHSWLYVEPPQVVDQHVNVFTVEMECRSEPRAIFRVSGGAFVKQPALTATFSGPTFGGAAFTQTPALAAGFAGPASNGGAFTQTPTLAAGSAVAIVAGGTFEQSPSLSPGAPV
jgi:hypothetical protein